MKFFIADAFTEILFGGNPAGIVWLDDAPFPDEALMQQVAAELRYSETVFIRREQPEGFVSRYFTPAAEVDLCGHATVGGFHALMASGILPRDGETRNRTKAGALQIILQRDEVFMEMGTPTILPSLPESDPATRSALYAIMGISEPEETCLRRFPVRIVSTGLPDIMLPVADQAALAAIRPDFSALAALSEAYGVTGVHAFAADFPLSGQGTPDPDGLRVHVRNFAPLYGIDEEAATGTANGALAWYLVGQDMLSPLGGKLVCIQGESMGRRSTIRCRLSKTADQSIVYVGGAAVILAEGKIHI